MPRSPLHILGAAALALATVAAGAVPASSAPAGATGVRPAAAPRALQPLARVRNLDLTLSGVYVSTGTVEAFSTPAVGDLDNDHRPDIVTATLDGTVAAYRASGGVLLWKTNVGRTAIHASPVIANVVNDGRPEVVIATMDGRVLLLNGQNGRVGQTFRQGAPLHCPAGVDCRPDGFFATPAIGDVDGDGQVDIVAASWDHTVYAWRIDSRLIFRRYLYDTLWSSPVIADVDRNGSNEVILGGDIHAGNTIAKPTGGLLWVLRRNGSTYPGYPYSTPGQTVWSSPAVADLNRDGFLDAVFGSGLNFADPAGRRAHAITLKTGRNLPGWPVAVNGRVMSSPAVGDLDGDGRLEVTFAAEGDYVYAYNANGSRRWAACNSWSGQPCTPGRWQSHGGTVIADVDGDGGAEVVSTLEASTRIFDGSTGRLEAEFGLGSGNAILPPPASPTVTEVDGKAVIVQQTIVKAGGHAGGARAGDLSRLHLLTTGQPLGSAAWPSFHGQPNRSARPVQAESYWRPMATPGAFVLRQYHDLLRREPDTVGRTYWVDLLRTGRADGGALVDNFLAGAEPSRVLGPVSRAAIGVLGRSLPTTAQLLAEGDRVRAGDSLRQVADRLASASSVTAKTDSTFVTDLYVNLYGRPPSTAEMARDLDRLASTWTRGQLAADHAVSAPAVTYLAPNVHIITSYVGLLGRVPDPTGYAGSIELTRTSGRRPVITSILTSGEYRRRVA